MYMVPVATWRVRSKSQLSILKSLIKSFLGDEGIFLKKTCTLYVLFALFVRLWSDIIFEKSVFL